MIQTERYNASNKGVLFKDKTVTTVKRNTNNVYIIDLHVALSRQTAS